MNKLREKFTISNLSNLSYLSYLKRRLGVSRKAVVVAVAVALVVTTFPIAAFLTAKPAKAAWYNDDWHYRKSISFTHTGAESNVYLSLSGANALDTSTSGRYQADCGDLRFTDANGNLLNYFLVSGCGTATTVVHVLYGTMPAGDQYLYVYYGNSTVANGTTSFDFATAATGITFGSVGSEETSQVPVAEWKFDEGYGTSTSDSSGNGNSGTLTNGPAWQDPSMCVSGKCLQFNGTNSYVTSTTNIQCSLEQSVSGWFRAYNTGGSRTLFELVGCGGRFLAYANGGNVTFYPHSTGQIHTASNFPDGQWHFFAVTTTQINGTQVTANIFVDGKLAQSAAMTFTAPGSPGKLTVGSVGNGSANYFKGSIDDISLYSYARTSTQIQQDYARGLTSLNQQQGNLSNGLVGYWKMDDNVSGNAQTLKDYSGGGNSATTNYGANTTGMDCTVTGKFGGGCSFDGVDDNATATVAGLPTGSSNRTMSAWVKFNSINTSATTSIVQYGANSTGALSELGVSTGGKFIFGRYNLDCTGVTSPVTGTWYFVSATYDGSVMKIYVNGALEARCTQTMNTTSSSVTFAQRPTANNFSGSLDETRIYGRNLSPSEIQQLYNFGPPPSLYYNFEEGAGTTVNDVSGNGNTGVLSSSFTSGKYGSALLATNNGKGVHSNTAMYHGTSSFTYEAWVKSADTDSSQSRIMGQSFTSGGYCYLNFGNGNILSECKDSNNVGGGTTAVSSVNIADNRWHHVVQVVDRSANKIYFYIDGALQLTYTISYTGNLGVSSDPDNLYIGYQYNNNPATLSLNGSIDEVKVYNYARSQYQVSQDYNAGGSALDSPVGWWKMDEGQGTTANNSGIGGSALNGTLTNMSSPPTSTSGWSAAGKYGNALNFDGTDDVVSVSNLDTTFFSRSFTVSAWAMRSDSRTQHAILSYSSMGSPLAPIDLALRGTNAYVQLNDSSGTTTTIQKGTTTTNKWYYLTAIYDASASLVSLYMNGSLLGTATVASPPRTSSGALTIGRDAWNGTMLGSIDEVKIWGSALSSQDILADYNRAGATKVGSAGTENVTTISGATGTQPSNSKNSEYCVPGDTSSCAGPVGEWKFEEGSGTSVADTSGNGNTGTWGGTGSSHWAPGKVGTAGQYNGIDDNVDAGNGTSFSLSSGATMEAWVYLSSSAGGFIVNKWASGAEDKNFSIDANRKVNLYFYTGVNTSALVSTTAVPLNAWTHITGTYDGTNLKIYMNGQLDSSQAKTGTISNGSGHLYIGMNPSRTGATNPMAGKIDQVRIYNYARTPAQVVWDYNKGGPVAWYKMDECSGSTVHSSTNPYNAALNGTTTIGATGTQTAVGTCQAGGTAWGNGASGKRGASLNFDGTDDRVDISTIDLSSGGFTLSGWFKTNSTTGDQHIIGRQSSMASVYLLGTSMRVDGTGGTYACGAKTTFAAGKWYHFVYTNTGAQNDASSRQIYINGKKDTGSCNAVTTTFTSTITGLGYDGYTFHTAFFNGQLDDIQVFNYVLTPTQISTLYNGGSVYWGQ